MLDEVPKTNDKELTELIVGYSQDIGKREQQQDAYGFSLGNEEKGSFFIVADGMGGMEFGDIASGFSVDFAKAVFEKQEQTDDIPILFKKMLTNLNTKVTDFSSEKNLLGMIGTTFVGIIIKGNKLFWASVGDSRIYLYKDNYLLQLSYDHVYENMLKKQVEQNKISIKDAVSSKQKGHLTSYIGTSELKEIDYNVKALELTPGDKVVLCSDGIYGFISESELVKILNEPPQKACDDIVDTIKAKNINGQDNMTIMTIEYKGEKV